MVKKKYDYQKYRPSKKSKLKIVSITEEVIAKTVENNWKLHSYVSKGEIVN